MMMIRGRSSAPGTIIEKSESVIFAGKVEHVHISLPYRLIRMTVHRNDQMVWKNRIGIDKNVIFLALSAVKLEKHLLLRAVFTT